MRRMLLSAMVAAGMAAASAGAVAAPEPDVRITEWRVPWAKGGLADPWVAGPREVWFAGRWGDYVARLDPETGEFERHDVPDGTGPQGLIADGRGVWYAGSQARHIGLIDPETGAVDRIKLPMASRGDVHTLAFTRGGDIWFSVQHGNQIGFLDTESREVTLYDIGVSASRPYGIVVDADDRPWAALVDTNMLATVHDDGRVEEIALPRFEARPPRLAVTEDGAIWYVDHAGGRLGRFDRESATFEEWPTPGGERSRPYAVAADDRGRLWLVETGGTPNRLIGFDPTTESYTEPVEIESGGTVRGMVFDPESRALWFTTDADTIGRASLD
jgi:virginiamycin B lyase